MSSTTPLFGNVQEAGQGRRGQGCDHRRGSTSNSPQGGVCAQRVLPFLILCQSILATPLQSRYHSDPRSRMRKQAQCGDGGWRQELFPETPENLQCVLGGRYGFPETPENLPVGPLADCSLRFFCFISYNFWFFQLFFFFNIFVL